MTYNNNNIENIEWYSNQKYNIIIKYIIIKKYLYYH